MTDTEPVGTAAETAVGHNGTVRAPAGAFHGRVTASISASRDRPSDPRNDRRQGTRLDPPGQDGLHGLNLAVEHPGDPSKRS